MHAMQCSRAAGLHHTAFTFAHESQVQNCDIDPNLVPPGALVTYIQKGLQYLEVEANVDVSMGVGRLQQLRLCRCFDGGN